MESGMMMPADVARLITAGKLLVLSGDEELLSQLPAGNWIGGTIPYFYLREHKGIFDQKRIFVTDFTDYASEFRIRTYDSKNLNRVTIDGYDNGFNFLILPALKDIHLSFAMNAPRYAQLYKNPLIGLIAGTSLADFAKGKFSKTYNGFRKESYTEKGVALHLSLPKSRVARLEMINVFEQDPTSVFEFDQTGFVVKDCLINGVRKNLYDYIKANNVDIRFPLTSDYNGAIVNVSFQNMVDDRREIVFYAPLFKHNKYMLSKPLKSYTAVFTEMVSKIPHENSKMIYNCNCILNYLYGNLEENDIGFSGPTTFGEIAYNMLNQTFTYLMLDEV